MPENPLSTLTEIRTRNRANFTPLDMAGSAGLLPAEMRGVFDFIYNVLVVAPHVYYYNRDGNNENIAIGLEVNADVGRRVRAVSGLIGFGPQWLKNAARFLPTLTLGGAFTPFATSGGGTQAHLKIEIGLPSFLSMITGKVADQITNAKASFQGIITLETKESWLLSADSPIDEVTSVGGGLRLDINGTQLDVTVARESQRRTVTTTIDGVTKTVVVEHVSTRIGNYDLNVLNSIGIKLGEEGRLLDDEWYVYEYGTRRPLAHAVVEGDRLFVGQALASPEIRNAVNELIANSGGKAPGATVADEIIVNAASRTPPEHVYDGAGLNSGARYNMDSRTVVRERPEPGIKQQIITGGRRGNSIGGTITTRDDGRRSSELVATDGRVIRSSESGAVTVDGQPASAAEAEVVNRYTESMSNAVETGSQFPPELVTTENGLALIVPSRKRVRQYETIGDVLHISETGGRYDVYKGPDRTEIKIQGNPLPFDFSDVGGMIGQQLGYRLAKGDKVAGVVTSAALQTIGNNLGDALDEVIGGGSVVNAIGDGFSRFGPELLANLRASGIGAVSSFLTSQLVGALNIGGLPGELANNTGSMVLSQVFSNFVNFGDRFGQVMLNSAGQPIVVDGVVQKYGLFNGVNLSMVTNAVGAYLGAKLAAELVTFQSIGGQIGAAVGTSLGVAAAGAFMVAGTGSSAMLLGVQLGALAGPLGAAIGAFVGYLVGGAIGSLFGGTPRSGADVAWDAETASFEVENLYSRKGGSKDAANSMASVVAETFNGILGAAGGTLLSPESVQTGNYGMRGKNLVYRPTHTRDKHEITLRIESTDKDAMSRMVGYGIYQGLADPDFKIVGGNVYVKRALYNTLSDPNIDPENFDPGILFGNIQSAKAYEAYLANSTFINAIASAEPDSGFTAETAINLARAVELGLTKRHASDWYGGFEVLVGQAQTNVGEVEFDFDYDSGSDKISRVMRFGNYVITDAIDVAGQTVIEGTDASDTIVITHEPTTVDGARVTGGAGRLANTSGLKINGVQGTGAPISIEVAATIDAGAGGDYVHAGDMGANVFGGAGNDYLYGGLLSDWLLGGDGEDWIYAGNAAPDGSAGSALGGDGNYLDGGAGGDHLYGREGSDWLDGGAGTDVLEGGDGNDILAGGSGDGDTLKGGRGDDSYIVRLGDGSDAAEEGTMVVVGAQGQRLSSRIDWLGSNQGKRNWVGDIADIAAAAERRRTGETNVVAAVDAGWDDAIVFGAGITLSDVAIRRVEGDLEISLTDGTKMVVAGWFSDPFKRVEWLKFADGEELRLADLDTFTVGGAGDDVLDGDAQRNFIHGGAGDDYIRLYANDDVGIGGSGSDALFGDEDDDLLVGGTGQDKVFGGTGHDRLSGDLGDDALVGEQGDDVLAGGRGDDTLSGGTGSNIFRFSRGDGRDRIVAPVASAAAAGSSGFAPAGFGSDGDGPVTEQNFVNERLIYDGIEQAMEASLLGSDYLQGGYAIKKTGAPGSTSFQVTQSTAPPPSDDWTSDTVEFAVGINIQDIVFSLSGGNLVATISSENALEAGSDSITFEGWDGMTADHIAAFTFYQTGRLEVGGDKTVIRVGGDGADLVNGDHRGDWITAGAGNDEINGADGADILNANSGDDVIDGGAGDDVVYGGAGQDRIKGGLGADTLIGGADNDLLEGGAGADTFVGGAGDDTVSYAGSVVDVAARLSGEAANGGDAHGDTYAGIENLIGGGGDDRLGGDDSDNVLEGGAGADILSGLEGDDSYDWKRGDGNDVIADTGVEIIRADGSFNPFYTVDWSFSAHQVNPNTGTGLQFETHLDPNGDPTSYTEYVWRAKVTGADGAVAFDGGNWATRDSEAPVQELLSSTGWTGGYARTGNNHQVARAWRPGETGGTDTLALDEGISLSDLEFAWSGDDLVITVDGRDDSTITLRDQRGPNAAKTRIETLQLYDGQSVSLASVVHGAAGAESDLVVGDEQANAMSGGAGNDVLWGGGGADSLAGAEGDDVFESGIDAERFFGGVEGTDSGLNDTVRYVRSGAGVTVDLTLQTAQASQGSASGDLLHGIENVTGSIFADQLTGGAEANRLIGLEGNNVLTGNGGNDVLIALGGNDTLDGGEGEDTLSGGDGTNTLTGGGGKDFLQGGTGFDTLLGGTGDDRLLGGEGGGSLDGGDDNDMIVGGSGIDTMVGGLGNDVLEGHGGGDILQGGHGDDQYVFESGNGTDTITDGSGKNTILFGGNIDRSRLWLTQDGNHLRIGIIGSDHVVKIEGFFATTGVVSNVHSVQAGEYLLYLNAANARTLIQRMTVAGLGDAPTAMNPAIGADLDQYWRTGNSPPETPALQTGSGPVSEGSADWFARFALNDQDSPAQLQLVDNPNGLFTVVGNEVRFAAGSAPDFEDLVRTGNYVVTDSDQDGRGEITITGTVRAIDEVEQSGNMAVTAVIEDLNEAPTDLVLADMVLDPILERDRLATDSGPGASNVHRPALALGKVQISDLDLASQKTGQYTYEVFENGSTLASSRFAVVDGELRLLADQSLDFESDGASVALTIAATNSASGTAFPKTFNFAISDRIDVLGGDEGNNGELVGQSGEDIIYGYGGDDVLEGRAGPDTLDGGAGTDIASYAGASARIAADLESKTVLADGVTDTLVSIEGVRGSAFADDLKGSSGSDVLQGGAGNDVLDGRGEADWMTGGAGDDIYVVNHSLDRIDEIAGEGDDVVYTAMASYKLAENVEKLVGTSQVSSQHLKDNALNNTIVGAAIADFIYISAGGTDTAFGNDGNDLFFVGGALDGSDRLDGGAGGDILLFQGNTDVLLSAVNAASIEGISFKAGTDTIFGVSGTYNYNLVTADSFVAAGLRMQVNASVLLGGETFVFDGSAETDGSFYVLAGLGRDDVKGSAGNDLILVDRDRYQANDRFAGGAGVDELQFRSNMSLTLGESALSGIETVTLLNGAHWNMILAYNLGLSDGNVAAGQTLTVDGSSLRATEGFTLNGAAETDGILVLKGGAGNDALTGGAGADTLTGGLGNDVLSGGTGADQMAGGAGNDLYFVDGAGGAITELADEGDDEVRTSLAEYTLASNVERLTGTSTMAGQTLRANALSNTVTGGASNDTLYLQAGGNDTASGGAGSDLLYMGTALDAGDSLDGGEGQDAVVLQGNATILSGVTLTGIESVSLQSGSVNRWGDHANNRYSYVITSGNGLAAAGARLIVNGSSLLAGENMTFDGSGEVDGYFQLYGGAGRDLLTGGAGNDSIGFAEGKYDAAVDKVTGGAGTDSLTLAGGLSGALAADGLTGIETIILSAGTASTNVSYSLTMNDGNVAAGQALKVDGTALRAGEALILDGSAETNGTFHLVGGAAADTLKGGAGADILTGGAGDDVLDGRAGADQMTGGSGNDTYMVDDALDTVTEAPSEGTADHVQTSLRTYTLGEGLENLTSTVADGATTFTGNAADNLITTGAASDRVILFTGGKDIVSAGAGDDVVIFLGKHFDSDDRFDLGAGRDQLALRGSVTATFREWHLVGTESIAILSGLDDRYGIAAAERVLAHYNLTTVDANVAANATVTVDSAQTVANETVRFDGRAETDGSFLIYGGGGTDTFFGGARDDLFGFNEGATGSGAFSGGDSVDGGAGTDKLRLRGAYTVAFASGAMTSIETLELLSGVPRGGLYNYNITMADGNVAAGALLAVDASTLAAAEKLIFVGSAETNGRFQITGGAGNDEVRGGSGIDTINTGAGNDTVYMRAVGEDIVDGGAGTDKISFADHGTRVVVNLATDAKLLNIENVVGGSAGDEITGSTGANLLEGGDGNDTLQGGMGADQLVGGNHVIFDNDLKDFGSRGGDTVSYSGSGVASQTEVVTTGGFGVDDDGNGTIDRQVLQTRSLTLNGVRVSLADNVVGSASTATGADAAGDQFAGIENLLGSASNDLLRGNSTASDVAGGAGEDLIYGGGGNDRLFGGDNDDVLYGQVGHDVLYGGEGNDRLFGEEVGDDLIGGAGNDILVGGAGDDVYHFARGDGNDRIFNFDPTGAFDTLSMADDILFDNLWFERVDKNGTPSDTGIDLRITVLGQAGHDGSVIVDDWFKTGVSPDLFQLDMITDSDDRATIPADIDELIAVMKGKTRPGTQAVMNQYLTSADFRAGVDGGWQKLTKPVLLDVVDFVTNEPLDNAPPTATFKVRAYYENAPGQNLSIPDSQIELKLVGADGKLPTAYVTHFDGGTVGSDGYRTVTLTLTPNGSTHLLTNGSLPVAITARLRGVADTKGTLTARDDFKLTILQTADTPTLSASSAGGNAGSPIAIATTTFTPDQDGSETVGALIGGVPAGYSLTNAAGVAVGTWQGFDPAGKALALVDAGKTAVTALGGGTYRIAKTGINQLDASAVSTTAMQGDFILRGKFVVTDSFSAVGMNSDPRSDHSYGSIDHGFGWQAGSGRIVENGVPTLSFAVNGDVWMWRKGTTVSYGTGPDFQTASTTGLIHSVTGATQALYFDSAFGTNNNTVDVQIVEAATRVAAADLPGLRLLAPAGRSSDATLTITPESKDGPSTRKGAPYELKVAVNAAPTDITTRGAGTAPVLNISESTATNNPIGKVVGIATAVDPDALDRNLVSTDFNQLARVGAGEERIAYAAGPNGPIVQVLETGQQAGITNAGSGVSGAVLSETLDSSKAYKFTVFVKVDNSLGHSFYFGADAPLENAMTGAATQGGGFVPGGVNTLQSNRWYRLEGYVLPVGHEMLAGQDLLGGIFDVDTGQKVANATTFRFAASAQGVKLNFGTYGNEQNFGFSTQWTQPQVEKLQYTYAPVGTNPLFAVNPVTGAIVAISNAIDFEAQQSHSLTVRVTDSGGLSKDKLLTVAVNNLNEPNSFPATPPTGFGANENAAGEIVGTVQATDIDSSATPFGQQAYGFWDPVARTFTATSADGRYSIHSGTGQIKTATALNYETMDVPVEYWVAARDNNGVGTYFQTEMKVAIAVRDLNERNSLPASYGMSVNENVPLGTAVGTVAATDLDLASTANGQQRYYFYNAGAVSAVSSDQRYTIDALTGQIKTNAALNFESGNPSVPYTVVARDRQGVAGTGAIFRDSFEELAVPAIGHKSDGGWSAMYRVTNSASEGNGALRVGMWGGHNWNFPGSSFVATQSTVTLSVMIRDSGVTNASVTGGWNGSDVDAAAAVSLGLHNETTDAWITATHTTSTRPPNGGAWVRHVQTITGLTVGQTYTVSAMLNAWEGVRASDLDALQVEYGSVATPFVGWSQAFSTVTVGVNDVNEANSFPSSYAMNVNENVAVGTAVGTVAATDIDSAGVAFGQQRYYFLNGGVSGATSSDGRYSIDAVTGTIKTAAALDRETMSAPVAYSVIARDNLGTGNQAPTSVTIGVNDVNEANAFATAYNLTVAENAGVGTQVGSVAANDADSAAVAFGQQRYYFWNGSAAVSTSTDGRYSIDAVTGAIRTATALNYEAMSAPAGYTVVAYDNAGNSPNFQASTSVTIGVSNVNEAPTSIAVQSQTFHSEVLPGDAGHPGKTIATFAMSDPDGTAPSLAILGGNPHGWFTTSGANLNFHVANFTSDWLRNSLGTYGQESGWYHDNDYDGLKEVKVASLTVAAVDAGGLQGPGMTYNVFIEDKNETPLWNATPYTFGLNENPGSYAYVGTVAGSDPDGPASELRYGFADWSIYYDGNIGNVSRSPDGRFLINNQNGNVYVNGAQAMDYESGQRSFSYSTLVYDRAAGPHALARAGTINVNLSNTNDSSTYYTQVPAGFTVTENTAVGTVVSDGVRATDPDGYGISYSIDQSTNPNGAFGVNAWGQIYVAGSIDHEAAGWQVDGSGKFANLQVLASDGGAAAAATVKINIGNIRKYVYNNGSSDYNLYETRTRSTNMGGNGEPGFYHEQPMGGPGGGGWYNETWLVERSTGLILSWMGEYSQWEGTTSRPFPHAGTLADGYVGYGSWPNPYTMYADDEHIMTGLDGVPQGQPYYPIVFDLGGDGFDLAGVMESGVRTDLNKDRIFEGSGWVKASDGFLVLDRNGDGLVLDWNEISFVKDKAGASTDLEGLVAFDSNGDFKLAASDARFDEFRLWVDANQDGIGQKGELRSLRDAGIVSISLTRQDIRPAGGSITVNSVLATAAFERSDGTVGRVGDIALGRLPQRGPDPEPGAPKFRFDEAGASGTTPGAVRRETTPETGGSQESTNEGTAEMKLSQIDEAQRTAAKAATGEQEAEQHSAQSAQAQTDLAPQAAELAERSFTGRKSSYSLSSSGGSLFVTGNKPDGAIDSRVQEVRPGSLLSFKNGTIGLVAPVVLDLDGDGVELKRRDKSNAGFDMDGNGTRDDTGWISKQDGFLVVDLDGDGRITSPAELSLLGLKSGAKSGLDALGALDSDKSGSIDSKDARFGELKLWVDANGNGVTDDGELKSLADRGIASVGLAARAGAESSVKIGRNAMLATSTFTRTDGSIGSVGDAALAFRVGKSTEGVSAALRQVAADVGADLGALKASGAGKPDQGLSSAVRQVAADVGADAAAAMEARDPGLRNKLDALRAGLGSRPLLSLASEGQDVFDRFARKEVAAVGEETSLHRMDVPSMQVRVPEEGAVQAEPAAVVPAADDLRLAKMVQDMSTFGLRSGEAEWKSRGQATPNFDYFA